jgi:hypothetical protein
MDGDSRGFDSEKANGGLPNGKNGLNGIVGPLPPDGMYHVSDMNGSATPPGANTNIDMIHGSLTDKVKTRKQFITKMPSTTCV